VKSISKDPSQILKIATAQIDGEEIGPGLRRISLWGTILLYRKIARLDYYEVSMGLNQILKH
jgi:hypothetical protein